MGHRVQASSDVSPLAALNLPALHCLHPTAPSSAHSPAPHAWQAVAPSVELAVPALQGRQEVAPRVAEYWPRAQSRH